MRSPLGSKSGSAATSPSIHCPLHRRGLDIPPTPGGRLPVLLDHAKGIEARRQVGLRLVHGPERPHYRIHRLRLAQVLSRHLPALHEFSHQAGRIVELRHDPRRNADLGGVLVRFALGRPVDPEERGVLARTLITYRLPPRVTK